MKLSLKFQSGRIEVDLFDTPTTKALVKALPFESTAHTWGEGFWTEGDAIALPR